MTAKEIFDNGMALMATNRQEDFTLVQYIVPWINQALAESLAAENSIRLYEGREELATPQQVASENDEIEYNDRLQQYALSYFIASLVASDDGDTYRAEDFRRRYVVALSEVSKLIPTEVVDVYDMGD
ncbi:MAG: hypothetical protein GX928_00680 [Ruminococcaceae bacterium]|nr:hypothetical protein [Oscillospiraceae bacterium]